MIKRFWRCFISFNKRIGDAARYVVDGVMTTQRIAKEQSEWERKVAELFSNTKKGKVTFEENARRGEENRMNYLWSITLRGWLYNPRTIAMKLVAAKKYTAEEATDIILLHPEMNLVIIPEHAIDTPTKEPDEPTHAYEMRIFNISDKSVEVMAQRDIPDSVMGSFLNKVVDYFTTAEI